MNPLKALISLIITFTAVTASHFTPTTNELLAEGVFQDRLYSIDWQSAHDGINLTVRSIERSSVYIWLGAFENQQKFAFSLASAAIIPRHHRWVLHAEELDRSLSVIESHFVSESFEIFPRIEKRQAVDDPAGGQARRFIYSASSTDSDTITETTVFLTSTVFFTETQTRKHRTTTLPFPESTTTLTVTPWVTALPTAESTAPPSNESSTDSPDVGNEEFWNNSFGDSAKNRRIIIGLIAALVCVVVVGGFAICCEMSRRSIKKSIKNRLTGSTVMEHFESK